MYIHTYIHTYIYIYIYVCIYIYAHVRVEQKHWVHTILAFLLHVHFVGKNVAMNIIIVKLFSWFDF